MSTVLDQVRACELIAGHPILDLVNTLDWRFREGHSEELLNTFCDLIGFTQQAGILTPSQARRILRGTTGSEALCTLTRVLQLREAAADVLYAALEGRRPGAASIETLENIFKTTSGHQKLFWSESRLVWDWLQAPLQPELPLWVLSLSAQHLMTSDEMRRVRACGNSECRWLFLDTSKNHTRRWCDMKVCGNRMKARRFKAQHRA